MSPAAALSDPVFRAYVGIVLGVLIVAGAVLALLQFVFHIEQGSIWKTYRSWLWMVPLAVAMIFAGRAPFIIGVTALALLGFKEFALVSGLVRDRWLTGVIYAGIVMVGIASLTRTSLTGVAVSVLALILFLPILRNAARGVVQRMSLGVVAFLYLGWMFGHLGSLANATNAYGYLCYLIFATEGNDVAGFTFGKIFGRHPLRSEISPRKTWEGALGALAVSMALPWLLRFSFPFFGPRQFLLIGLIVGIGAPLGDLSISVIKRDLGAKDWGAAIPGHGGILDRIDSLIFVAPLFMLMTEYYYPGR
jgi:phosphatidate cytidylyltransferase